MSTLPIETAEDGELSALRQELEQGGLTIARIERTYRQLARFDHLADLKVAWLGNHTLEPAVRHAT